MLWTKCESDFQEGNSGQAGGKIILCKDEEQSSYTKWDSRNVSTEQWFPLEIWCAALIYGDLITVATGLAHVILNYSEPDRADSGAWHVSPSVAPAKDQGKSITEMMDKGIG